MRPRAAFKRMRPRPPRGVLLYGPPGSGKTLLAKAVATESEANFISIKGPEVMSKWVGESEKAVRMIFKKAKQVAPCIVFLDEIDAIAHRRGLDTDSGVSERGGNQLLTSLDGLETMEGVVVIAATNRPDMVDTALLRTGRYDRLILVPVPDKDARLEILKVHTKEMPLEGVDIEELAVELEGYTGADIEGLCREAAMIALRENKKAKKVTMVHFQEGRKKCATELKGKTVMTNDGQILGMIENFIVDTRSGKVLDVLVIPAEEIEPRLFKMDAQGRIILPFQGMKAIKDVVVMNVGPQPCGPR